MNILVLNPGSATLKFGLYQMPDVNNASSTTDSATVLASGSIEPVGQPQSKLTLFAATQKPVSTTVEAKTPAQAVKHIIRQLLAFTGKNAGAALTIDAVGCRVVHGGARLVEPTRITPAVLDELRALKDLAPLHNPVDVAILEQAIRLLPDVPVVAVFDTAFHRTLPPVAYTYAIPMELCARYGLRRYGFHGLSHAYVSRQLITVLGRGAGGTKIITCHLGNGASICAVRDGQSVDISSGFTPLEGLVMGTRSGDIDPGLILYLIRATGMTASKVNNMLNRESGLRGLSGLSADVRDLEKAALEGNAHAELALQVFAYRTRKYIGAFAAALGGLEAIAFTGGIGEHSASMRNRICQGLEFLGVRLEQARNKKANDRAAMEISAESSPVQTWMIPTDEEQEIAWSTYKT
ncbi:MAG: acetate kinase [Thermoflexales bacterium]